MWQTESNNVNLASSKMLHLQKNCETPSPRPVNVAHLRVTNFRAFVTDVQEANRSV